MIHETSVILDGRLIDFAEQFLLVVYISGMTLIWGQVGGELLPIVTHYITTCSYSHCYQLLPAITHALLYLMLLIL